MNLSISSNSERNFPKDCPMETMSMENSQTQHLSIKMIKQKNARKVSMVNWYAILITYLDYK